MPLPAPTTSRFPTPSGFVPPTTGGASAGVFGLGTPSAGAEQFASSYLGQVMKERQLQLLREAGLPLDSDPSAWSPDEAEEQTNAALAKIAAVNPELAKELESRRSGAEQDKSFFESIVDLGGELLSGIKNFGLTVLDVLTRPARVIPELLTDEGDPWYEDVGEALSGKSQATWADVLEKNGVENTWVRGIVGFGLDVATDPLTYLTFGSASIGRHIAARTAGKAYFTGRVQAELGQEGLETVASKVLRNVTGKSPSEIGSALYDEMVGLRVHPDAAGGLASFGVAKAQEESLLRALDAANEVHRLTTTVGLARMPKELVTRAGTKLSKTEVFSVLDDFRKAAVAGQGQFSARALGGAMGGVRLSIPFTQRWVGAAIPGTERLGFQWGRRFFTGHSGLYRLTRAIETGQAGATWDDFLTWMEDGYRGLHEAKPELARYLGGRTGTFGSAMYAMSDRVGRATAAFTPHAQALRNGGIVGSMAADFNSRMRGAQRQFVEDFGLTWRGPNKVMGPKELFTEWREVIEKGGKATADDYMRYAEFMDMVPGREALKDLPSFIDEPGRLEAAQRAAAAVSPEEREALLRMMDMQRAVRDEANANGLNVLDTSMDVEHAVELKPEQMPAFNGGTKLEGKTYYARVARESDVGAKSTNGFALDDAVSGADHGLERAGRGVHLSSVDTAAPAVEESFDITPLLARHVDETGPANTIKRFTDGGTDYLAEYGPDGQLRGVAQAAAPDATGMREVVVGVRPEFRRQGIGTRLVQRAGEEFKQVQVSQVTPQGGALATSLGRVRTQVRLSNPLVVKEGGTSQWDEWYKAGEDTMEKSRHLQDAVEALDENWEHTKALKADEFATKKAQKEGYDGLVFQAEDGTERVTVFDPKNVKVENPNAPTALHNRGYFPRTFSKQLRDIITGRARADDKARVVAGLPQLQHSLARKFGHLPLREAEEETLRVLRETYDIPDGVRVFEMNPVRAHEEYVTSSGLAILEEHAGLQYSRIEAMERGLPDIFGGAVGRSTWRYGEVGKPKLIASLTKRSQVAYAKYAKRLERAERYRDKAVVEAQASLLDARRALEGGGRTRLGVAGRQAQVAGRKTGAEIRQALVDATQRTRELREELALAKVGKATRTVDEVKADIDQLKVDVSELRLLEKQPVAPTRRVSLTRTEAKARLSFVSMPTRLLRNPDMVDASRGVAIRTRANSLRSTDYINQLKESVGQSGMKKPVEVVIEKDGKLTIIDGTHRLMVADELGMETVPVHIKDLSFKHVDVYDWLERHAPESIPGSVIPNQTTALRVVEAKETLERFGQRGQDAIDRIAARRGVTDRHTVKLFGEAQRALQEHNRLVAQLRTEVAKAQPALVEAGKSARGFSRLTVRGLEGKFAPAFIAEELNSLFNTGGRQLGDMRKWWRSHVLSRWKVWNTIMAPGFHVRNHAGAWFNNTLGGVAPRHYDETLKIWKAWRKPSGKWAREPVEKAVLERYHLTKYVGERATYLDVWEFLNDTGINSGHARGFADIVAPGEEFLTGVRGMNLPRRGRVGKVVDRWEQVGSNTTASTENFYRSSAFLRGMEVTGGDVAGARAFTMMRHGDYVDLTDVEFRVVRDLVPFYKWFRTNFPHQMHNLLEAPGQAVTWTKMRDMWYEVQGEDWDEVKRKIPKWMQEEFFLPLGGKLGSDTDPLRLLALDLPMSDLAMGLNDFVSMGLPIVMPMLESTIFEKKLFSGETLDSEQVPLSGWLSDVGFLLEPLGLAERNTEGRLTIPKKWAHVLTAVPVVSRFRNFIFDAEENSERRIGSIMSLMFGANYRDIDEKTLTGAELEFYFREVEPIMTQLRSLGVQFPRKDEVSDFVYTYLGLEPPTEEPSAA